VGSWIYAYLRSQPEEALKPNAGLGVLSRCGLSLDDSAHEVDYDDEGHGEAVGRAHPLGADPWAAASSLLLLHDLQITARSSELYYSCKVARRASKPHMVIGWSRSLFREMAPSRRHATLEMLSSYAQEACAACVVLVCEPLGYFEESIAVSPDRIEIVADETSVESPFEVWSLGRSVVVGDRELQPNSSIGQYARFVVKGD
jgi:hypothetical protein